MDMNGDFAALVAQHQRLSQKYRPQQCFFPSNPTGGAAIASALGPDAHIRYADISPRIDAPFPASPLNQMYTTQQEYVKPRCCPRCNYCMDPGAPELPSSYAPNDKDAIALPPQLAPNAGMNLYSLFAPQMSNAEYARLLSTFGVGQSMMHHRQMDPSPEGGQMPIDLPAGGHIRPTMTVPTKRKMDEMDENPIAKRQTIPVKRSRLVWTPDLHSRFVQAVTKLGLSKAVPKAILEVMGVEGLTRENVASHLQKYRLQIDTRRAGGTIRKKSSRPSAVSHSSDLTESDLTASDANNTGDSATTGVPGEL